jgi:AbrB family looped-hinge helix DNA binding protein
MQTSSITSKGQVTIPAQIRKSLALTEGQKVRFSYIGNVITITPVEEEISAVFGLLKAKKTVSLEQMETAIIKSACDD